VTIAEPVVGGGARRAEAVMLLGEIGLDLADVAALEIVARWRRRMRECEHRRTIEY
jgi:hypothetical protein